MDARIYVSTGPKDSISDHNLHTKGNLMGIVSTRSQGLLWGVFLFEMDPSFFPLLWACLLCI